MSEIEGWQQKMRVMMLPMKPKSATPGRGMSIMMSGSSHQRLCPLSRKRRAVMARVGMMRMSPQSAANAVQIRLNG